MKKFISLAMAAALCLSLAACGSSEGYFWGESETSTCFKGSDLKAINNAVLAEIGK